VRVSHTRSDAEAAIESLGLGQRQGLAVTLAKLVTPFRDLDPDFFDIDLGGVDQELDAAKRTLDMVRADKVRHTLFLLPNLGEEPEGLTWFAYRAAIAHIYAADALTTAPRDGVRNSLLTVEDILDNAESSLGRRDLLPLLYALVVGQPRPDARLSAIIPEVVQALRVER
jgi:hypothetical protein